eukprot:TRINITY_DN5487_c0_g1_i1.p1 TRINITY_DN5487_c0_g1~~TRINITY_DN5487_c0_g1_i1.p1  ORF type:complete len:262 (-),score=48.95 TRINITY_DN5487_c0_g1_i1:207-992(-)
MSDKSVVLVTKKDCITIISINRAHCRNAVDGFTARELLKAFREFESDDKALVAILAGEGGTFCSGADLKAVASGDPNRMNDVSDSVDENKAPMGLSRMLCKKPVIAAIDGWAVAGGLELALWADLRVMEEDAIMGVFCRRFGVPLMDGGTVRLPRLIGFSRAMDLILTGRPVDSKEALAIGLANRVVSKGKARESAEELARLIASFPQECMRGDRKSAYEHYNYSSTKDALKNEFEIGLLALEKNKAKQFASGMGRHGAKL